MIDVREVIESSIFYCQKFNLKKQYLYMGSCEMYHYFYDYNEITLIDENFERFIAIDHELGEVEYKNYSFALWYKDISEEIIA